MYVVSHPTERRHQWLQEVLFWHCWVSEVRFSLWHCIECWVVLVHGFVHLCICYGQSTVRSGVGSVGGPLVFTLWNDVCILNSVLPVLRNIYFSTLTCIYICILLNSEPSYIHYINYIPCVNNFTSSPSLTFSLSPSLPPSCLSHSFFVVEDTVLHTSQTLVTHQAGGEERDEGLVSRPIVHEFWSMASAEVLAVLRTTCVSLYIQFHTMLPFINRTPSISTAPYHVQCP